MVEPLVSQPKRPLLRDVAAHNDGRVVGRVVAVEISSSRLVVTTINVSGSPPASLWPQAVVARAAARRFRTVR